MWSIVMEPGKKYSTVVDITFHLSMATLDLESVGKSDDVHTVYVETDDNPRVILCHLSKASKLYQCQLNHIFSRGTNLKFVTSATANIHMTGYFILNEDNEFYASSESESEEGTVIPVSKPMSFNYLIREKKYKYKSIYTRHMKKRPKQKLYKCLCSDMCNEVFKIRDIMLRHVVEDHIHYSTPNIQHDEVCNGGLGL